MDTDGNYLQNNYIKIITFGGLYGRKDKRSFRI
jgi:hypothetical protein